MIRKGVALVLILLSAALPAAAYVEPVHVEISHAAYDRVRIDFQARLGVQQAGAAAGTPLRILLGQGANNEDLFPRSLNHFFDPIHRAPLSFPGACLPVGIPAVDWALEESALNNRDLGDAKAFYFDYLLAANPGTRDVYLKELFLTLGHVIHLVQDMAQPEHTRNDQHLEFSNLLLRNGTAPSVWEEWGETNLLPQTLPNGARIPAAVSYDGYPNVALPDYRSYFTSPTGMGLADFANRSFVTQDTNYGDGSFLPNPCNSLVPGSPRCFTYDAPRIADAIGRTVTVNEAVFDVLGNPLIVTVDERVFTSLPFDSYLPRQEIDPFHTFH
ncbi:MAG TPA: hypothetical protein VEU30_04020 [Thermoanaerobaculia bacterium]|nr:hypothetical protein [Thermoanaerobaculia bacterium]